MVSEEQVVIRFKTVSGIEQAIKVCSDETRLNLELKDIASIDLLPLVWCKKLQCLTLRYNRIEEIDLAPLAKCPEIEEIDLRNNLLREINLSPLANCPKLREIRLEHNRLRRIDVSPLFECPNLQVFGRDDFVSLTASIFLRSIGNWPDVLMNEYHRILWTHKDAMPRPRKNE